MIKKWLAFYFALSPLFHFAPWAQAEIVVIKGPSVSPIEYSAYLQVNSERVSPTKKYLNSHPSEDSRSLLLQKLASAQQEFLSGSLENAKKVYQEITDLLYLDDWEGSDLEAILFSHLRIAQLSATEDEKEQWLKKSLLISSDIPIQAQLFPPPLLLQRQRLAKSLPKTTINLLNPDFTLVINGKVVDSRSALPVELFPGRYRVTFLNNSTAPETRTLEAQDISKWSPNQQAMYQGSCPLLKSLWNSTEPSEVYGGEKCHPTKEEPTHKMAANRTLDLNVTPNIELPSPLPKPIYQQKWFWVGVGAIAVVALAASQNSQSQDKRSTTYGF